jgi:hypothetical protein
MFFVYSGQGYLGKTLKRREGDYFDYRSDPMVNRSIASSWNNGSVGCMPG